MSSRDVGSRTPVSPGTLRGRDWPCLRQFGVFLENRVGILNELLRHIERADLRIIALSIVDSADSAVARLILSHYDRARELFDLSGFAVFETDVIGVQLPDTPQPFVTVCSAVLQAEVSIHYTYPLLYRKNGRGAIAMYVDDIDQGLRTMHDKRLHVITERELLDDDENL